MVPPPPPPPTAVMSTDGGARQDHPGTHSHTAPKTTPGDLNDSWTTWSSSLTSRALDPLSAAAVDLADFASRHREAALAATSDVQLAKIHAQAEQCATQALLTITEYLNRAAVALDMGASKCSSELQVLSAALAAIEQRVAESYAVSAIQSLGSDAVSGNKDQAKAFIDFASEEAVKIVKQTDVSSGASTKSGRSNSHVPGLPFQSHGPSSSATSTTAAATPTAAIPVLPKLDLTSLDALGTPLPDLSALVPKAGSIKQQSHLSTSPLPSAGSGSTTSANNLDLSMLGDVSQNAAIRRKNSNVSTATGATTGSAPPALSSVTGTSIDDLSPPPPPPPGAPPANVMPPPPPPTDTTVPIPTQTMSPPTDPRGSVRSVSVGMVPTQQAPMGVPGGSVHSVQGISAPQPLYAHQPPPMAYAHTQHVPVGPGSHMGTYAGGSVRGQPIGLGQGVNGGYGVPPQPMPPMHYAPPSVIPPRSTSAQGLAAYATSGVPVPGANSGGSIGYGYAAAAYPMQQVPAGPGSRYASVNQPPMAMDPASGYALPPPPQGGQSTSPQLAPAPPPPMGMAPPPPGQVAPVVLARVLYPYTAAEADEMHLVPGEVVEVLVLDAGAGWAKGVSIADRRRVGMFPRSYVQLL